jgi:hypothetical protein
MFTVELRSGERTQVLNSNLVVRRCANLQIVFPEESILEVVSVTGNYKYAHELALREVAAQRPFSGLFRCVIHKVLRTPEGAQVICSITPALSNDQLAPTGSGDSLRASYVGYGSLIQLCGVDTDVAIQVGVKLHVLRLRNGLLDFQVIPIATSTTIEAVFAQIRQIVEPIGQSVSRNLYLFRICDRKSGASHEPSGLATEESEFAVLEAHLWESDSPPRLLSEQELAATLVRSTMDEPLDPSLHSKWRQTLLTAKRFSTELAYIELCLIATIMALLAWGAIKSGQSSKQLDQALNELALLPSVAPALPDTKFERELQSQIRMLKKLGDPRRVTSIELASSLQALRDLLPSEVRVHEVTWTPVEPETQEKNNSTNSRPVTGAVPVAPAGGQYQVTLSLPTSYKERITAMDSIVSRAAQYGFHVEESTPSATGGATSSEAAPTSALVFRPVRANVKP